jgi:integrase
MRLNDRTIAALPASGYKEQKTYTDDSVPGFGVRVGSKTKTFVLTYGDDRRRVTIGRYPIVSLAQAREKARTILAQRQLGLDQLPALTPTFKEVMKQYLAGRDATVRWRTRIKDEYVSKIFSGLSEKRLADITAPSVQAIIDDQDAPWTRHYCLGFFSGVMRYAIKHGHIDNWPLARLEAPITHHSRERVLTDNELRAVLQTARMWAAAGNQFGTIVELLVLTGQRRQQIGSLDRAHVEFDNNTITWPPELMKNNRKHTIPMGESVRALLPDGTNGLYFPNLYGYPFTAWSVHFTKFKLDSGTGEWTLHDLRRTLATRWQELGIQIATTEKMLSHSAVTGGLVGIYQRHSYLTEMRSAVVRWENWLQTLQSNTESTNGAELSGLHHQRA